MSKFLIVSGPAVFNALQDNHAAVRDIVGHTYLQHSRGKTVNPDSYFLRFPRNEANRIIALPCSIEDAAGVSGIKWISSFPGNLAKGLPRASAILIINDAATGFPIACLEGSQISAARTAASAALAARCLSQGGRGITRIGTIGIGPIAQHVLAYLCQDFRHVSEVRVTDLNAERARQHASKASAAGIQTRYVETLEEVFEADLVVLATTASRPYIGRSDLLRPGQVVLNVSLRDLEPQLILDSWNIVDDIEHCLKAETSPHLAEQMSGSRGFIAGTIADLMLGRIVPDRTKSLIFSPFGLGVLDLAVGRLVLERAISAGSALTLADFFTQCVR